MIETKMIHKCFKCGSENICKNGKDSKNGKQKYRCNDCESYGTLNPQPRYSEAQKERALRVYQERASLRGAERALGISRQTIARWLKKSSGSA